MLSDEDEQRTPLRSVSNLSLLQPSFKSVHNYEYYRTTKSIHIYV